MRLRLLPAAALVVATVVGAAAAHEVRPAYLAIRQTAAERYDVLWKVPARGDLRLSMAARFPASCSDRTPPARYLEDGAFLERRSLLCPGGLTGQTITIEGLAGTMTDALVRIERADGATQTARLSPAETSLRIAASPSRLEVARSYLGLGIEHILLGVDHLLFVLALLILVDGRRRLIGTITAFTLAHSLTLAAATLGWVRVPQAPVEAVIALSILFVAGEIIYTRQGRPGLTRRWPWVVAFTFGLLHGFGFAGALTEIGLPASAVPMALLFFNVGVELGQLIFIGVVEAAWALLRRVPQPRWAWRIPAYAIGTMAAFWVIQRVAGFWG